MSQSYQSNASDDACRYIADKASHVVVLKHLHTLIGKGGEGGETSTEARGKQQAPWMGQCAMFAEMCEQDSENKASEKIDRPCTPRESGCAGALYPRRESIPQRSSEKASYTDD